jgi:polyferredoxin
MIIFCLLCLTGMLSGQDREGEADSIGQTDSVAAQADSSTTESAAVADEHDHDHGATASGEQEAELPAWLNVLFSWKFLAILGLILVGLVLLFGRLVNRWVRIGVLAVAFALFGLELVFPLHPSPMCALTKLFMFRVTWGMLMPAFIAMVVAMLLPSLFGRKLFCGWVCPLGAVQDLINKVPFKPRFKQFNFGVFNTVRFSLLILFVLTFFGVKNHIALLGDSAGADLTERTWVAFSSYDVYEPINMFELLHWQIDTTFIILGSILVLASLTLYRPFCYLICPIGAITWLMEKIAPMRVRVNRDKCIECGDCYEASPCPTIKPMVERKAVLPDCTSCGECIRVCEENAIRFGLTR